jgi:NADH-quinone oxidoreductase subunit L
VTHAFFKALLFLAAGSVIHAIGGEQDLRKMGGLWKKLPVTFAVTTVGVLAIAGIFPFAGVLLKGCDPLRRLCAWHGGKVLWFAGLVTALLTSFYMFRLWYLTFLGNRAAQMNIIAPLLGRCSYPLVILGLLSICGGWIGIERFAAFLAPSVGVRTAEAGGANLELMLSIAAVGVAILGWYVAHLFYKQGSEAPAKLAAALPGWLTSSWPTSTTSMSSMAPPWLSRCCFLPKYVLGGLVDSGLLGGAAWLLGGTECSRSASAAMAVGQSCAPMRHGWLRARRRCCSLLWFPGRRCWPV